MITIKNFLQPLRKWFFTFFLISLFVFSSCRPDRMISSYVVRNKLIEKKPESIDTVRLSQLMKVYDRENRSYAEVAVYVINKEKRILISNDLFNDPVRFNIFAGFTRGFSINDKYEKVNYVTISFEEVKKLIEFYDKIKSYKYDNIHFIPVNEKMKARGKHNPRIHFDYNFNNKDFISVGVYYVTQQESNYTSSNIAYMNLWINGRKTEVDDVQFIKTLKNIIK